jgi:hypothetical protein
VEIPRPPSDAAYTVEPTANAPRTVAASVTRTQPPRARRHRASACQRRQVGGRYRSTRRTAVIAGLSLGLSSLRA